MIIIAIIIFLVVANLTTLVGMSLCLQQEAINSVYNEIKNAEPGDLTLQDVNLSLWSNKQKDFLILNGTVFYSGIPVLQVTNKYLPAWYMNTVYFYQYYQIKKFRKLLKDKHPNLVF